MAEAHSDSSSEPTIEELVNGRFDGFIPVFDRMWEEPSILQAGINAATGQKELHIRGHNRRMYPIDPQTAQQFQIDLQNANTSMRIKANLMIKREREKRERS